MAGIMPAMRHICLVLLLLTSLFGRAFAMARPTEWVCEGRICARGALCCCDLGVCAPAPTCASRPSADHELPGFGRDGCHCTRSVSSQTAPHPAVVQSHRLYAAVAGLPVTGLGGVIATASGHRFAAPLRGPPVNRPCLSPVGLRAPPIA